VQIRSDVFAQSC